MTKFKVDDTVEYYIYEIEGQIVQNEYLEVKNLTPKVVEAEILKINPDFSYDILSQENPANPQVEKNIEEKHLYAKGTYNSDQLKPKLLRFTNNISKPLP